MREHTVEKIGGTSMSRFGELMENILIGKRRGAELYNRIFVVSAYGGITNMLLEDKKTGEPGIYELFIRNDNGWVQMLERTRRKMLDINKGFADLGLDQNEANAFVNERMDGIRDGLRYLMKLRTFGHFQPKNYMLACREFLCSVGEAHSAYNAVAILKKHDVNAIFVDLTGWKDDMCCTIEQMVSEHISSLNIKECMPIVTGYVKCGEGIMHTFDRGYSEITFSKIAVLTEAKEGIIHKEFHLSTGDPKLIGVDKVKIIGNTNYDIADQLADLAMEAIHPRASKDMEQHDIPIRILNAFDPENEGTLISKGYVSPEPRVDMICGRSDMMAIEIFDPLMVGQSGYDYRVLESFAKYRISYVAKNTNANTITHYVPEKIRNLDKCLRDLEARFPDASIRTRRIALVSVIGSNMKLPGFLSRAATALADAKINVIALDQCMRQVNMQFVVDRDDFSNAQIALHKEFVEK